MVIFLYGPDTYRSRRKLQEMKQKFIEKKDQRGFSVAVLEANNLNIDAFRKAVLSQGLFVAKRLIIIENLLKQKKDKALIQEIFNYLKKIKRDEDNVVIFWDEAVEKTQLSDIQKQIFDLLIKGKYSQEFPLLSDKELVAWIKKEVLKQGNKIQPPAAQILAQQIGPDLWRLSNELDKLSVNTKLIGVDDVKLLADLKPEDSIWLLVDAVGEKNKKRAVKLLADQIEIGAPLGWIFSMLVRQYRILLQIKEAIGDQESANHFQIAQRLKLHPFVCQKALRQAKNYSLEDLKKIYGQLLDVETKIKTTSLDPEVLLNLLIINQ